jgi:hypothetical protein
MVLDSRLNKARFDLILETKVQATYFRSDRYKRLILSFIFDLYRLRRDFRVRCIMQPRPSFAHKVNLRRLFRQAGISDIC